MIWLAIAMLAGVALAPLALSLRRAAAAHSRRDAAIALHRAQLVELDRDLADGRIAASEQASAVLEVQRRLLAAAVAASRKSRANATSPVWFALVLVPIGALALYLVGGSPDLPAQPLADRIAAARQREEHEAALIAQLRRRSSSSIRTASRRGRDTCCSAMPKRAEAGWRRLPTPGAPHCRPFRSDAGGGNRGSYHRSERPRH